MRSTGEVLGLAENFPLAFYKSQLGSGTACGAKTVQWTVFSDSPSSYAATAAGSELPHAPAAWENKKVLISLSNKEGQKEEVLEIGKTLKNLGFTLVATQGTADFYNANGIKCDLVINTPKAKRNYAEDRKTIRKTCLKYKVSYITTLAGALAAVKGIEATKNGNAGVGGVKSLQEYHSMIK